KYGVQLIRADVDAINRGEDRQIFKDIDRSVGAAAPRSTVCGTVEEALAPAEEVGYPVVIRPSFTMRGPASGIATDEPMLRRRPTTAAKLPIGNPLAEITTDITGVTPASCEPSLHYVVVKIPRFAFEKFPGADPRLTTTMKSVGEVMSLGRNFAEALGKAMRSMETTAAGFWTLPDPEGTDRAGTLAALRTPHDGRLYTVE